MSGFRHTHDQALRENWRLVPGLFPWGRDNAISQASAAVQFAVPSDAGAREKCASI